MIDSSESGRPDALNIGPFCYRGGLPGFVYLLFSVHNSPVRARYQLTPVCKLRSGIPGPESKVKISITNRSPDIIDRMDQHSGIDQHFQGVALKLVYFSQLIGTRPGAPDCTQRVRRTSLRSWSTE
jgi:hypothetical protein